MNKEITKELAEEEVKRTVVQLGGTKAPIPYGFPGLLNQKYWSVIDPDIIIMVKSFLKSGILWPTKNCNDIILIPKTASPTTPSKFRPISLCNFSYKIISRVVTNGLKPFLNAMITLFQIDIVSGRLIHDNIVIAHEAFHYLRKYRRSIKKMCHKASHTESLQQSRVEFYKCTYKTHGIPPTHV